MAFKSPYLSFSSWQGKIINLLIEAEQSDGFLIYTLFQKHLKGILIFSLVFVFARTMKYYLERDYRIIWSPADPIEYFQSTYALYSLFGAAWTSFISLIGAITMILFIFTLMPFTTVVIGRIYKISDRWINRDRLFEKRVMTKMTYAFFGVAVILLLSMFIRKYFPEAFDLSFNVSAGSPHGILLFLITALILVCITIYIIELKRDKKTDFIYLYCSKDAIFSKITGVIAVMLMMVFLPHLIELFVVSIMPKAAGLVDIAFESRLRKAHFDLAIYQNVEPTLELLRVKKIFQGTFGRSTAIELALENIRTYTPSVIVLLSGLTLLFTSIVILTKSKIKYFLASLGIYFRNLLILTLVLSLYSIAIEGSWDFKSDIFNYEFYTKNYVVFILGFYGFDQPFREGKN